MAHSQTDYTTNIIGSITTVGTLVTGTYRNIETTDANGEGAKFDVVIDSNSVTSLICVVSGNKYTCHQH